MFYNTRFTLTTLVLIIVMIYNCTEKYNYGEIDFDFTMGADTISVGDTIKLKIKSQANSRINQIFIWFLPLQYSGIRFADSTNINRREIVWQENDLEYREKGIVINVKDERIVDKEISLLTNQLIIDTTKWLTIGCMIQNGNKQTVSKVDKICILKGTKVVSAPKFVKSDFSFKLQEEMIINLMVSDSGGVIEKINWHIASNLKTLDTVTHIPAINYGKSDKFCDFYCWVRIIDNDEMVTTGEFHFGCEPVSINCRADYMYSTELNEILVIGNPFNNSVKKISCNKIDINGKLILKDKVVGPSDSAITIEDVIFNENEDCIYLSGVRERKTFVLYKLTNEFEIAWKKEFPAKYDVTDFKLLLLKNETILLGMSEWSRDYAGISAMYEQNSSLKVIDKDGQVISETNILKNNTRRIVDISYIDQNNVAIFFSNDYLRMDSSNQIASEFTTLPVSNITSVYITSDHQYFLRDWNTIVEIYKNRDYLRTLRAPLDRYCFIENNIYTVDKNDYEPSLLVYNQDGIQTDSLPYAKIDEKSFLSQQTRCYQIKRIGKNYMISGDALTFVTNERKNYVGLIDEQGKRIW